MSVSSALLPDSDGKKVGVGTQSSFIYIPLFLASTLLTSVIDHKPTGLSDAPMLDFNRYTDNRLFVGMIDR